MRIAAWVLASGALAGLLASCVTTGTQNTAKVAETARAAAEFPRITLSRDAATLGDTVRHIGENFAGGLVLMNGIQEKGVPPLEWKRKPYGDAVRELAALTKSMVAERPGYYFLHAEGYETLAALSLAAHVPEDFGDAPISFHIGNGTALYNAFSLLSYHTRKTIIASNAVAEARCGEIALAGVPLIAVIEALLQSARVPAGQITFTATDTFVFIDAATAPPRGPFLLNTSLDDADEALLAKRVTAVLPIPPKPEEGFVFYPNPLPLSEMLRSFSAQCGVRVEASPALADVPINPCAFVDLPLRTALGLLLRQWPVAGYGYEVRDGGVLIRAAALDQR